MRDAPMGKGSGEWGLRFGNEILRLRFAALRMTCRWGAGLRSGWHVGEEGRL